MSISGHVVRLKGTAHVSSDGYFDSLSLWERAGKRAGTRLRQLRPSSPTLLPSGRRENESEIEIKRRKMTMRFMVIVKADKNSEAGVMPSKDLLTEMGKFNEELVKAGVMLAGEGLHASSKGAR